MGNIYIVMLILGLIQGIAEFLPISSSGHLVLLQNIPYFEETINSTAGTSKLFINVALHLATLIAIIIYFRKDIFKIILEFLYDCKNRETNGNGFINMRNIIIACIPAGIIGLMLHDIFENEFSSPIIVFFMLTFNGIVLISTKIIKLKSRKLDEIGIMSAFFIGLFQAIAIIPGISRSGMTITGGMIAGLKPEESARFSFLMAIPVIAGAGLLEVIKAIKTGMTIEIIIPLFFSIVFTVLIALISLKVLFIAVKKVKVDLFGYYTILVGILGIFIYYYYS